MDAEETFRAIDKLILKSSEIKMAAYCVSKKGISIFEKSMKTFLKNGGSLDIMLGCQTLPDVLETIKKLEKSTNKSVNLSLYWRPTFHSKFYIFKLAKGGSTSIVGSSNLTWSALSENIETNIEVSNATILEDKYNEYLKDAIRNRNEIKRKLNKVKKINETLLFIF